MFKKIEDYVFQNIKKLIWIDVCLIILVGIILVFDALITPIYIPRKNMFERGLKENGEALRVSEEAC